MGDYTFVTLPPTHLHIFDDVPNRNGVSQPP